MRVPIKSFLCSVLGTHARSHCTGLTGVFPPANSEPPLAVHRHGIALDRLALLCDAGDGLDIGIAANRAFDATTRTQRAGAQYPLLQRRISKSASANAKHFSAFGEKPFAGLDSSSDTSGAGFGVTGRGEGKQQASSNQGFHGTPFCFGSDLRNISGQYNLG